MKLIKTINKENEIVKLYNQPLDGGISVKMNGRQYWMVTIKKDFINSIPISELADKTIAFIPKIFKNQIFRYSPRIDKVNQDSYNLIRKIQFN